MSDFLTVQEAARLTGRSASSLRRRIIYPITEKDDHPDRPHIRPTVEDVKQLRMKGEIFPWRISRELLDREAPSRPSAGTTTPNAESTAGDDGSLVSLLRQQLVVSNQQLAVKDVQIASLHEVTKSLNDRLREGNIIMVQLQQQLALTSGRRRTQSNPFGVTNVEPDTPPAKEPQTPRPPKTSPKKPTKKGWFAWGR